MINDKIISRLGALLMDITIVVLNVFMKNDGFEGDCTGTIVMSVLALLSLGLLIGYLRV
jgi:hypothetical protein